MTDPTNRLLLALLADGMLDILQGHPDEGVGPFTKAEFAQARRDRKRLKKRYDDLGRFVEGHVLCRQEFIREVLQPLLDNRKDAP